MEKKNTALIILTTILAIVVVGLSSYIVYDKVFKDKTNVDNQVDDNGGLEQNTGNQDNEQTSNGSTNNEEQNTGNQNNNETINNTEVLKIVKDKFLVAYKLNASPNPYCGDKADISTVAYQGGNNYYVSSQFTTYDKMVNYLKGYMTEEIINSKLNKDNYLEKDGKLYCANFGKGSAYDYGDQTIELREVTSNSIKAKAAMELVNTSDSSSKLVETFEISLTKVNDNWVISSYNKK